MYVYIIGHMVTNQLAARISATATTPAARDRQQSLEVCVNKWHMYALLSNGKRQNYEILFLRKVFDFWLKYLVNIGVILIIKKKRIRNANREIIK